MLDYIRKHVTEWPEGATGVWLCEDGKITFDADVVFDFFPDEKFEGVFVACKTFTRCSETYTREQWERTDLTTLDTPFGELDRATQLRLVEHVLDGGRVEFKLPGCDTWCCKDDVRFRLDIIHRAKR
jgi:hypothetical protein